jgi:hypothetical protein
MATNAVVYQGHGLPAKVPFHITPGMRHAVEFEFVDELEQPVDQTGTAWSARLHDAITGEEVAVYTEVIAAHIVTFTLTQAATLTVDPQAAYEVRIVRDTPGPDMIFAGAVLFTAETVPVTS